MCAINHTTSLIVGGVFLFCQQICATYFVGIEENACVKVGTGSPLAHEIGYAPS